MLIKAFFSEDIAHLSYMLIGENEIFVIDPQRHIQIYLEEAKKRDLPITGIMLTHPHADFISGHMELIHATEAKLYAHFQAPYQITFEKIKENDIILLDHIKIKVLETPGHTPYCTSFVVSDLSRGEEPVSVFTGDTLFVGDVGRPDLFPEIQKELAEKLYHSLFDKLLKLPEFVEVYPAHASGSMCGKKLSEKRATTIGYEKRYNNRVQIKDANKFVQNILNDNLPVPEHFKYCAKINLENPQLLESIKKPEKIDFEKFIELKKTKKPIVLDIRKHWNWVNFHLDNSLNIDLNCLSFANYAGWLLDRSQPIIMIHDNEKDLSKAISSLRKIGLDQEIYFLEKGIQEFIYHAYPLKSTRTIMPKDILNTDKYQLVDVRNNPPALEIFSKFDYQTLTLNDLIQNQYDFSSDKEKVILCQKGALASLVISILENQKAGEFSYLLGSGTALQNLLQ